MNKRQQVLLVEDDADDYVITRDLLRDISHQAFDLTWEEQYDAGVTALTTNAYDVALVDYHLGEHNGVDLIRKARAQGMETPVIMLTGEGGQEADYEAMQAGAEDYLVKGQISGAILERSIRYAIAHSQAAKDLRIAEAQYRTIFEGSVEGIFRVALDGHMILANPALARIAGVASPEELLKARWSGERFYVVPGRRQQFFDQILHQGSVVNFESEIKRPDGRRVWISESGRVVRDASGQPSYFEGTVRDVTVQRQAEEEHRQLLQEQTARVLAQESEHRAAFLAEASQVLSSSLDEDTTLQHLAELAVVHLADWCVVDIVDGPVLRRAVLTQADPQQSAIADFLRQVPPIPLDHKENVVAQVVRQGTSQLAAHITNAMLRRWARNESHYATLQSGKLRSHMVVPLVARGQRLGAMTLVSSQPTRIYTAQDLVIAEDLAGRAALAVDNARLYQRSQIELQERRRAEDAVQRSERRFRTLIEQGADVICLVNLESRPIYISPSVTRVLGYSQDEFLALASLGSLIHPDDYEQLTAAYRPIMAQPDQSISYTFRLCHQDGHYLWVDMVGTNAVHDPAIEAIVFNFRDSTERLRIAELQQQQAEAAAMRAEVSLALAHQGQLREVLQRCTEALVHHGGVSLARIWLYRPEDKMLTLQASAGVDVPQPDPYEQVALGEYLIGQVAAKQRPYLNNDLLESKDLTGTEWVRSEGLASFAGYPLVVDGRLIGVLSVLSRAALSQDIQDAFAATTTILSEGIERKRIDEERERLVEQLRAEEARLQAVLHQMPAGVLIVEVPSGTVLLANSQVEEILRRPIGSTSDILAKEVWSGFHVEGRQLHAEASPIARTIRHGEVIVGEEYEYQRDDGTRGYVLVSSAPIWRTHDQMIAAVVTFFDTTDRREAEEALAKSYSILNSVIQGTTDAVYVKDLAGRYILVNPATARMFGRAVEEIIGKRDDELFTPEVAAEMMRVDQTVLASGQEQTLEETLALNGSRRTYLSTKGVYRDQEQQSIGIIGVAHDITERTELERQKDEFLGIASHELKTPVTSIKAFTQILQRRFEHGADDEVLRYLGKMDGQMNKLTNLINSLLDVTKISSGQLELQLESFRLDALVQEVADDVRHTSGHHQLQVEGELPRPIRADRDRVAQVLLNLLSNAVKYSPQAELVRVMMRHEDGWVFVDVQDFGIGIALADQRRVFDRFYRSELHPSTIAGLGLGLYISEEIVRRHGGRLTVESALGKGSVFSLALPITPERVH